MTLFTIIACIGSLILTLTRPVASQNQWAFDPESCNAADQDLIETAVERAVLIGKGAAIWLPAGPRLPTGLSSKPDFAGALLGSGNRQNARSLFNGGQLPKVDTTINERVQAKGIAKLGQRIEWPGRGSRGNVVRVACDVQKIEKLKYSS